MAKKPNLAAALAATKTEPEPVQAVAVEAGPLTGKPTANRAPGREGQTNISGWFDSSVKFTLEELRLKRQRELGRRVTIQELMGEAYNELFKKYGFPEVAPSGGQE
ncbi:MAG: ribbon-helix-helix domain-containing protein [Pseudomonadota bacterium]